MSLSRASIGLGAVLLAGFAGAAQAEPVEVLLRPATPVYGCSKDGWRISFNFELMVEGEREVLKASPDMARVWQLEPEVVDRIKELMPRYDHDMITTGPGPFRRDIVSYIDEKIDSIEARGDLVARIGMGEGVYDPICPMV